MRGFGYWNYDFKTLCLVILSLLFIAFNFRKRLYIDREVIAYFALPLILLLTPFKQNIGLSLDYIVLITIGLYAYIVVFNSKNQNKFIHFTIIAINILFLFDALAKILLRKTLTFDEFFMFSYVGNKNAQSIWLVISSVYIIKSLDFLKSRFHVVLCVFVISLSYFVAISFRTRSSWWALLLISCYYLFKYLNEKDNFRRKSLSFFISIITAFLLFFTLPSKLKWNSDKPYLESLKTSASLDQSSGRKELWTIAYQEFSQKPFFGHGLNSTSLLIKDAVYESDIKPEIIISPFKKSYYYMNDYIQSFVETGIFIGVFNFILFLILPLYIFVKRHNEYSLVLFLIATNALVDIPYHLPHLLILFFISLAIIHKNTIRTKINVNIWLRLVLILLVTAGLWKGGSLLLRHPFFQNSYNNIALSLWPFDQYWGPSHIDQLSENQVNQLYLYSNQDHDIQTLYGLKLLTNNKIKQSISVFNALLKDDKKDICNELIQNNILQQISKLEEVLSTLLFCTPRKSITDEVDVLISNDYNLKLKRQRIGDYFILRLFKGSELRNTLKLLDKALAFAFYDDKSAYFLKDKNGNREFKLFYWEFTTNSIIEVQGFNAIQTAHKRIDISKDKKFIKVMNGNTDLIYKIHKPTNVYFDENNKSFIDPKSYTQIDNTLLNKDGNVLVEFYQCTQSGEIFNFNGQWLIKCTDGMQEFIYSTSDLLLTAPKITIYPGAIKVSHMDIGERIFTSLDQIKKIGSLAQYQRKIDGIEYFYIGAKSCSKVFVFTHGGPQLRDTYSYDYLKSRLISNAYCVVSYNFRGSLGYGKEFSNYTWKDVALQVNDLEKVLSDLPENLEVEFVSESYGSYVLYHYLKKHGAMNMVYHLSPIESYGLQVNYTNHKFFFGAYDEITNPFKFIKKHKVDLSNVIIFSSEGHHFRRISTLEHIFSEMKD